MTEVGDARGGEPRGGDPRGGGCALIMVDGSLDGRDGGMIFELLVLLLPLLL